MLRWIASFFFWSREIQSSPSGERPTGVVCSLPMEEEERKIGDDMFMVKPVAPHIPWQSEPPEKLFGHIGLEMKDTEPLKSFLMELENKFMKSIDSVENQCIFQDVNQMITEAFHILRNTCPLFEECQVHKMGSSAEGTKIGVFDEFDFMIEFNAAGLHDMFIHQCIPSKDKYDSSNCVHVKSGNFILDFVQPNKVLHFENGTPDMFATLKSLLSEAIFSVLLPAWKPGPNFKIGGEEDKGKVRTIRLRKFTQCNHHIDVFLDFAFCISFQWTLERRLLFRRSGTRQKLTSLDQTYYILIRDGQFYHTTTAIWEIDKLNNSNNSQQVKRVYRLAKMLIKTLLPPFYDFELDTFEGLIPSYWLKQILFFMMDDYPCTSLWTGPHLAIRVAEIFFQLRKCLRRDMLTNYFSPFLNHVIDNSKTEKKIWAGKYIPILCYCLNEACLANKIPIEALEDIISIYRDTVRQKSKQMRSLFLLLRYKGLAQNNKHYAENTKFFSGITNKEEQYRILEKYMLFHQPHVNLYKQGRHISITTEEKTYSLEEYIKFILDDPLTFPDDWMRYFDKLCLEKLPPGFKFGYILETGLSEIGRILRTTFGDNPHKMTSSDEFQMTYLFTIH